MRSLGLELEARTKIGRNLNVIAAYAYTDARTTQSNDPTQVGKRTGGVPYNQAFLRGDYVFAAFGLQGFKAGLGVRYVGETTGVWIDGRVPDFVVGDAIAAYQQGRWRYALKVTNFTDKEYVASCTYECFYGSRRQVIGSVTYRW